MDEIKVDVLKKIQDKKLPLIVALIHFASSFFTDRYIFYSVDASNIGFFIFAKISYLIFLLCLWIKFFNGLRGKRTNTFEWKVFKSAIIYFIFLLIGVICLYPAVEFGGDMPFFFRGAINYDYSKSLHWLTSMLYILGMMFFPTEAGPTILMAICASAIYGYITEKFILYGNINKWMIRIVFFFPPFAFYAIYPNRLPHMTLFLAIYFCMLIDVYMTHETISKQKAGILILLTGMLSVWRMECLTFLIIGPLLVLLSFREKINIKKYAIYFFLILCTHTMFNIPAKMAGTSDSAWDRLRPVEGYVLPLMMMSGLDLNDYPVEYEIINKFLDIGLLNYRISTYGDELYRADYIAALGVNRENPTVTQEDYLKALLKVIMKNPKIYLKVRCQVFIRAMNDDFAFSGSIADENGKYRLMRTIWLYIFGSGDCSVNIHGNVVGAFLCTVINYFKNIIYSLVSLLFIVPTLIYRCFKQRNWFCLACIFEMVCYSGIVFLFVPGILFKYYWPLYCLVILVLISGILWKGGSESVR